GDRARTALSLDRPFERGARLRLPTGAILGAAGDQQRLRRELRCNLQLCEPQHALLSAPILAAGEQGSSDLETQRIARVGCTAAPVQIRVQVAQPAIEIAVTQVYAADPAPIIERESAHGGQSTHRVDGSGCTGE